MRRRLPTILILMVMVLVGAMFWVDLSYYTDPGTGFVTRGQVWMRVLVLALPVGMALLGLPGIGPRALAVLRVKSRPLGGVFAAAAAVGVAWGVTLIVRSLGEKDTFHVVLGVFALVYGSWMFMACLQMVRQQNPSPTGSAVWGMLASLPFAMVTIYRILVSPSSVYRVGPLVRAFSGLVAMLWFGFLLRSFYVALPRRRVRLLYFIGVLCFLFSTCLEFPLSIHQVLFGDYTGMDVFESLNMAMVGLAAGCMSVAIAGQSEGAPRAKKDKTPAQGS